MTPTDLRAETPALQDDIYLNFDAHGPSPETVVAAAGEFVRTHEYEGSAGTDPYKLAFGTYDQTRARVAEFFGADYC